MLKVYPSVSTTDVVSPSPLTPEMAKAWFESQFGKSKTISPPTSQTSSFSNDSTTNDYYFNQTFQITPAWTQSQISTYMAVNPIVIVPVQPIAFLDSMNQEYALIFFRDSTNQVATKLQVYTPYRQYRQSQTSAYDVNNFSGLFYQIRLDGKVECILEFQNGQATFKVNLRRNENIGRFNATNRSMCSRCNNNNPVGLDNLICALCEFFKVDWGGASGGDRSTDVGPPSPLGYGDDRSLYSAAGTVSSGGGGNNGSNNGDTNLGRQLDNTYFATVSIARIRTDFETHNLLDLFDQLSLGDILTLRNVHKFLKIKNFDLVTVTTLRQYLDAGFTFEEFDALYANQVNFQQVNSFLNRCDFNEASKDFVRNISKTLSIDGPGYPHTHQVIIELRQYNEQIWWAFEASNNTSTKQLHESVRGLAGPDAYGKCIGAIGEGIMGKRILTGGVSVTGSSLFFGYTYAGYAHDLLQVTNLPRIQLSGAEAKFELKVNFTDENGNPLSTQVSISRANTGWLPTIFSTGKISYEVKTNDPLSSVFNIKSSFLTGVDQVIARSKASDIDAGILIFDKAAFEVIKGLPDVQTAITRLNSTQNARGEQISFLRIESNLSTEAKNAYYGIGDKIRNINP